MKLYDIAFVCRSKNAGPFQLTVDLMFSSRSDYDRVLSSPEFTPEKTVKISRRISRFVGNLRIFLKLFTYCLRNAWYGNDILNRKILNLPVH